MKYRIEITDADGIVQQNLRPGSYVLLWEDGDVLHVAGHMDNGFLWQQSGKVIAAIGSENFAKLLTAASGWFGKRG